MTSPSPADLNGLRAALKTVDAERRYPDRRSRRRRHAVRHGGAARSRRSRRANSPARLVGGIDKVVNSIAVRGRDQVMLKVTVAEVQRNIIKQLGIDLSGTLNSGTSVVNFNNSNPFTANGQPLVGGNAITTAFGTTPSVQATIRAMESAGVVRTLAEPNLTAISGESATFIAGGEFPIPTGVTCQTTAAGAIGQCAPSISLQEIRHLAQFHAGRADRGPHQPAGDDRSVRSLDRQRLDQAITRNFTVPSIKTRRAETTLEIPSGGAMAMAGLIQEQTKLAINGLPGLAQLPVLGTLFRSRDFVNNQTELMVIVTPYIVRAVAQKDLSRPDDGFAAASDPQADLLGSINRIYGVPGRVEPARNYRGTYGFITD